MNIYSESRADLSYYKLARNLVSLLTRPEDSILDVGSNQIDLISHLPAKEKISIDIAEPFEGNGVTGIKTDFFDYNPAAPHDVVVCCQVLEHIPEAKKFAAHLLEVGKIVVVSVPWLWPKGFCPHHCQDPVNHEKLAQWFGKEPLFEQVITDRLLAVFASDERDNKLKNINGSDFKDFFQFSRDADTHYQYCSPNKNDYSPLIEEYKKLKIHGNSSLEKYADWTYEKIASMAIPARTIDSSDGYNPFYLFLGLELYPFNLDKFGHPFFFKEILRWLLNNGGFKAANLMLHDSTLPSQRMMDNSWSKILFERACKKFGKMLAD